MSLPLVCRLSKVQVLIRTYKDYILCRFDALRFLLCSSCDIHSWRDFLWQTSTAPDGLQHREIPRQVAQRAGGMQCLVRFLLWERSIYISTLK